MKSSFHSRIDYKSPFRSNNNNVDVNYNTINQDSNSIVSNSENTNMVMAIILPVPGKRSIENINR